MIVAIGMSVTSDVNETISYIRLCNKLVIDHILVPLARYWALRHYCANIWLVALEAVNNYYLLHRACSNMVPSIIRFKGVESL